MLVMYSFSPKISHVYNTTKPTRVMNKILEYILSFTKDRQDRVAVGAMASGIVYIALVFILVNFIPEWYKLISISASFIVTLAVGLLNKYPESDSKLKDVLATLSGGIIVWVSAYSSTVVQ